MPTVSLRGHDIEYAEEQEVLDFANAIRAAGGADPLEALMRSWPNQAESCLIARAFNFNCRVFNYGYTEDGDRTFMMDLGGMEEDQIRALADAVGCEVALTSSRANLDSDGVGTVTGILLPQRINNVVTVFDSSAPEALDTWPKRYVA